jgi:hypothetical protein
MMKFATMTQECTVGLSLPTLVQPRLVISASHHSQDYVQVHGTVYLHASAMDTAGQCKQVRDLKCMQLSA